MALGAHRTWRVSLIFFVLVGCSASERQSNTSTECPEGTSVSGAAPPRGRGYHCQKQVNGQWVRHGPAAVWTDKGKIWQGTFRDGRMEGPWTFNTFEGRKIADIEFTDGVPSIADRPKCRQGNKADTDFIWFGGSPPPDEFFQFRVGCIAERADALDTPVEGPYVAWMIRGEKVEVGEIRDGKNHGAIEAWYRNGKPSMRGQHENGTQVGEWTWWHETGGRRLAGMYVDGKRHGEWTIWHQDGSSKIEKYALGTLIPEPSQQVAAKVGEKQCLQLGGTWG